MIKTNRYAYCFKDMEKYDDKIWKNGRKSEKELLDLLEKRCLSSLFSPVSQDRIRLTYTPRMVHHGIY